MSCCCLSGWCCLEPLLEINCDNHGANYSTYFSEPFFNIPNSPGLTQAEAEAQYGADNIKVYQSKFTNMYYSMTTRKPKTYMKLVMMLHVQFLDVDKI